MTRHELKVVRRCPVNDGTDIYDVTVETHGFLKVEDILAAVAALPEVEFQENITLMLAQTLRCSIITVGYHSGVKTTCTVSC